MQFFFYVFTEQGRKITPTHTNTSCVRLIFFILHSCFLHLIKNNVNWGIVLRMSQQKARAAAEENIKPLTVYMAALVVLSFSCFDSLPLSNSLSLPFSFFDFSFESGSTREIKRTRRTSYSTREKSPQNLVRSVEIAHYL